MEIGISILFVDSKVVENLAGLSRICLDRVPGDFAQSAGNLRKRQTLGGEPILLGAVHFFTFTQDLCRSFGHIFECDPTAGLVAAPPANLSVFYQREQTGKVLHENIWVQECPWNARLFYVRLNHLVPCEVWIGAIKLRSEYSQVYQVLNLRFTSGVNKGFALGYHGEGVPGQEKDTVNLFKCRSESTWIIQV